MKELTRPFLLLLLLLTCHLRAVSQAVIPLENYVANLKAVQEEIQGKPYRFLFDMGGGETIVSPVTAQLLQVNTRVSTSCEFAKVSLQVSGQSLVAPAQVKEILYNGVLYLDFAQQTTYCLDL